MISSTWLESSRTRWSIFIADCALPPCRTQGHPSQALSAAATAIDSLSRCVWCSHASATTAAPPRAYSRNRGESLFHEHDLEKRSVFPKARSLGERAWCWASRNVVTRGPIVACADRCGARGRGVGLQLGRRFVAAFIGHID